MGNTMQCLATFSRKGLVLMSDPKKVIEEMEFVEVIKEDKDGNTIVVKVY
jgi:hypothetical protein